MEGRKEKKKKLQKYRLYGCHFIKEEYIFIQKKIKKLSHINGQKRNNTQILIELFKLALRDENEMKG
ncbi:hypothetical protein [Fusobacterium ulcerans]|uniref:Uncharacterized protein n=1 Tax=Fusobacterium ulcerans TaxID=861 RepID=A0AAX2J9J1_9FUSO|nr:hypothetical protein [Fusobacterium ulcerans]AVQ27974.1 hypothetical protein C4N20_07795 [Fusobacterium ulcerans]EFS25432.1 hypothetical protein FUAG_00947 [Fusobacterium ulcerans ATCC 49185]SQI99395.1 Uncharacterised protein [Fusobacterium ulcerans]